MSRKDAAVAVILALIAAVAVGAFLFDGSAGASWPGRPGPVFYVAVTPGDHRYSYETHGLRVLRPGTPGSERQLTTDPTDADPRSRRTAEPSSSRAWWKARTAARSPPSSRSGSTARG